MVSDPGALLIVAEGPDAAVVDALRGEHRAGEALQDAPVAQLKLVEGDLERVLVEVGDAGAEGLGVGELLEHHFEDERVVARRHGLRGDAVHLREAAVGAGRLSSVTTMPSSVAFRALAEHQATADAADGDAEERARRAGREGGAGVGGALDEAIEVGAHEPSAKELLPSAMKSRR